MFDFAAPPAIIGGALGMVLLAPVGGAVGMSSLGLPDVSVGGALGLSPSGLPDVSVGGAVGMTSSGLPVAPGVGVGVDDSGLVDFEESGDGVGVESSASSASAR